MIEGLNDVSITSTFDLRLQISTSVSYKDGMALDVLQELLLANL
jgi:hypothetical protein